MTQQSQAVVLHDCRRRKTETLLSLARTDERIVAVCNDLRRLQ